MSTPPPADDPFADEAAFEALLEQARAGSAEACTLLYERYSARMLRVIRQRFLGPHDPMRRLVDSFDLVQIAWSNLFAAIQEGKAFATERDFIEFLLAVTSNCCRNTIRTYARTQKRSLHRDRPLGPAAAQIADAEPGPAACAAAADEWQAFVNALPLVYRHVFVYACNGEPLAEIAGRLRLNLRLVQRIVARTTEKWEQRISGGGENRGAAITERYGSTAPPLACRRIEHGDAGATASGVARRRGRNAG